MTSRMQSFSVGIYPVKRESAAVFNCSEAHRFVIGDINLFEFGVLEFSQLHGLHPFDCKKFLDRPNRAVNVVYVLAQLILICWLRALPINQEVGFESLHMCVLYQMREFPSLADAKKFLPVAHEEELCTPPIKAHNQATNTHTYMFIPFNQLLWILFKMKAHRNFCISQPIAKFAGKANVIAVASLPLIRTQAFRIGRYPPQLSIAATTIARLQTTIVFASTIE
ncbi:hypothetical protein IEQ34_021323 [Dendrobium chrysotoxum]|uniref:Uncharacterized protein n=1 Tax=Dendrobium chrysotoxum TaxID=161865 RepID=A0AAV7G2M8_DENCH|nr:hypothetical protein IEQ34_021323 [Dendrobium chrysotoxum]